MTPRPIPSAGFALMAALFVLVTLASISVYLLTVSTGQLAAATQDEQAARAYQAARAGIEYGAFQLLRNATPSCANVPLALPGFSGAGETSYSANITCTSSAESEGGVAVNVYLVTATGCNRPSCPGTADATYVERQLQVTITR